MVRKAPVSSGARQKTCKSNSARSQDINTRRKNDSVATLKAGLRDRPSPPSRGEQRSLATRPPLDRMGRILALLVKSPGINRTELARELETTVKTIQRDLNFLRSRWKLPIYYQRSLNGFTLEDGWEKHASLIPQLAFFGMEETTPPFAEKLRNSKSGGPSNSPGGAAWPHLPIVTDSEASAEHVSIEFSESGLKLLSRSRRLAGLKLRRMENGAHAVSFKVEKLADAEAWILSWGEHARVLKPAALVDRIQQRLAATQKRYLR
jgi:hypothetical protein